MTSHTESPQAATDLSFGEVTNPTSNIDPTTTATNMEKNTAPETFHRAADNFYGHFTGTTNANPRGVNTTITKFTKSTDSNSPVEPMTDAASPPPEGAIPFSLPGHGPLEIGVRGQPSHWTDAEERRLAIAVVTCGEKNWDTIAMMMPGRSKASCRRKWILSANGWTLKDDIPLREAVEACGLGNWDKIAARMPGHTAVACRDRWAIVAESIINRSADKASERLPWTCEQEERLVDAVETCGTREWDVVGAWVPGRSGLACREKWKRMAGKWSLEEDLELVVATKACSEGNWKEIASKIPKRTSMQCRLRYSTIMRRAARNNASRLFGSGETEATPSRKAKTSNEGDSVEVAEACSRQPRTDREKTKLTQLAKTSDMVIETFPCLTKVACSGQSCPWTDLEIERLIDAVKIYGEWGKWAAIAAMVPSRSDAECRLKWTSATPVWTPHEDMLLAVAVKACDEGAWLQIAARVPGRTRMDCLNRWKTLAEASRIFIDQPPRMNGGATNPVGVVETARGEANGATIASELPGRSDLQNRMKRQRIFPSVEAVPNLPKGLPVDMTAPSALLFPSAYNGTWVSHQLPLLGQSNLQFHSKQQHMPPPAAAVHNQPKDAPMNVTGSARSSHFPSPPFPSVNAVTWVPYQLPPRTAAAPLFQHSPPIYDFPPMLFTRHHY